MMSANDALSKTFAHHSKYLSYAIGQSSSDEETQNLLNNAFHTFKTTTVRIHENNARDFANHNRVGFQFRKGFRNHTKHSRHQPRYNRHNIYMKHTKRWEPYTSNHELTFASSNNKNDQKSTSTSNSISSSHVDNDINFCFNDLRTNPQNNSVSNNNPNVHANLSQIRPVDIDLTDEEEEELMTLNDENQPHLIDAMHILNTMNNNAGNEENDLDISIVFAEKIFHIIDQSRPNSIFTDVKYTPTFTDNKEYELHLNNVFWTETAKTLQTAMKSSSKTSIQSVSITKIESLEIGSIVYIQFPTELENIFTKQRNNHQSVSSFDLVSVYNITTNTKINGFVIHSKKRYNNEIINNLLNQPNYIDCKIFVRSNNIKLNDKLNITSNCSLTNFLNNFRSIRNINLPTNAISSFIINPAKFCANSSSSMCLRSNIFSMTRFIQSSEHNFAFININNQKPNQFDKIIIPMVRNKLINENKIVFLANNTKILFNFLTNFTKKNKTRMIDIDITPNIISFFSNDFYNKNNAFDGYNAENIIRKIDIEINRLQSLKQECEKNANNIDNRDYNHSYNLGISLETISDELKMLKNAKNDMKNNMNITNKSRYLLNYWYIIIKIFKIVLIPIQDANFVNIINKLSSNTHAKTAVFIASNKISEMAMLPVMQMEHVEWFIFLNQEFSVRKNNKFPCSARINSSLFDRVRVIHEQHTLPCFASFT